MNAYNDASLIMYPSGYKAGKLYSLKPTNGTGDFTVVRNTTATRVDALGLIESVAANVPRIDYTGGGCGSLLVEPAATNLVLRSEEFSVSGTWAQVDTTITANDFTAPNGTMTADRMNIAGQNSRVTQSFSLGATTVTFSIYLYSAVSFTLRIVAVVDGSNVSRNITITAGQWTRFAETFTSTATITSVAVRGLAGGSTGDIFLWGAQLETGSVATSYIPTVAATVTRNADVISLTSASALIGQTDGTLYAEVDVSKLLGTVVRGMLTISNNTTANRIQIGFTGASANTIRVIYSGASTLNYNFAITTTGIYKIAFAYSASSTAFYVNGSLVSALGGNSFSASVGNVYLGSVFDGTSALNDRISAAALYTFRLSNAELIELTTL